MDTARLDLIWGTSIRGRIECSGPYYNDINFSIADSGDNVVFNPERIYSGYEFRWQAWSNDIYYFKFHNIRGWTKTVGYSWSLYLYFHMFLLIGAILTVIGLILTLKEALKLRAHS